MSSLLLGALSLFAAAWTGPSVVSSPAVPVDTVRPSVSVSPSAMVTTERHGFILIVR